MTAKENLNKYGLAALKGGIGSIPGGSLVVELLNVIIPDRRLERVEKLLMILASKELEMDSQEIKHQFYLPEFADIFEDVIHQAVRALSDERLEYLASILERSLSDEQIKHLKTKRLLLILGEINDVEIIILQSYELKNQRNGAFKETHQNIFKYEYIATTSSQEEKEQNAILQNYKDHLVNLGLIGLTNSSSNSTLHLTPLGGMLLNKIGLEQESTAIGEPISSLSGINAAETKYKELKKELDKNKLPKDNSRKTEEQEVRELAKKLQRYSLR